MYYVIIIQNTGGMAKKKVTSFFSFAVLNGEGLVTKDTAGKFLLASGQQLL